MLRMSLTCRLAACEGTPLVATAFCRFCNRTFFCRIERALPLALRPRSIRAKGERCTQRQSATNQTERSLMPEYDVILRYEIHSYLPTGQNPEEYLFNIPFQVIGLNEDREIVLGEGHAIQVRIEQARYDRASLHDIFDVDQGLTDMARALFDTDFIDYHPDARKRFEDNFFGEDILIVRQLILRPKFRGQKLGLSVLHRVVTDFGLGCGIVVIKPYPLSGAVKSGREKLRKYWATLGFKRIGRSDFWALSLCYQFKPAAEFGLPSSLFVDETKH